MPAYTDLIAPSATVFDIGAHNGHKAELFLSLGAKVVCFEPRPEAYSLLRYKFQFNRNVHAMNVALADKESVSTLSICSSDPTVSTMSSEYKTGRFADKNYDRNIEVRTETLDRMIQKFGKPAYCKIDVEGFEMQVLSGLSQKVGLISFEFASEFLNEAGRCVRRLQELGYRDFNWCDGENVNFAGEWIEGESLISNLRNAIEKRSDLWGDIWAR